MTTRILNSRAIVFALMLLVAGSLATCTAGYVALTKEVTLSVDGEPRELRTFASDVDGALAAAGIELEPGDVVSPSLTSPVESGTTITVRYRKPLELVVDGASRDYWTTAPDVGTALVNLGTEYQRASLSVSRSARIERTGMTLFVTTPHDFTVTVGGKTREVSVAAATPEAVLDELGIATDSDDLVRPGRGTILAGGEEIEVIRVAQRNKSVAEEEFWAKEIVRKDPNRYVGNREVVRQARPGVRDVTYRVVRHNGEVVERKILRQTVHRKPVAGIVVVGTKEIAYGVWDRLAACESGGNWSINTGNGYYGGLQFHPGTWRAHGGTGLPHQHSRETQIKVAEHLRAAAGGSYGAWPHCAAKLGLPR